MSPDISTATDKIIIDIIQTSDNFLIILGGDNDGKLTNFYHRNIEGY